MMAHSNNNIHPNIYEGGDFSLQIPFPRRSTAVSISPHTQRLQAALQLASPLLSKLDVYRFMSSATVYKSMQNTYLWEAPY